MTSLVDRYVYTALRRVPEQQRADIDRELRASIADAVDARVDAGAERDAAVEATLTELGDPDRLADSYAGRSGYLIGPALFPPWRRLTVTLLSTVLPLVVAVLVVLEVLDGSTFGEVIGTAVTTTLTVGVQMLFWTTLIFAIIERTGTAKDKLRVAWSVKDLPKYEPSGMPVAQLAMSLVWPVLLIAALVWQQFTLGVPVLDPANWSFWWPYFIVVLLLQCAYQVWVWRLGTWNRTVTLVNAVLQLAGAVPLVWLLATDRFFNPEFHRFATVGPDSDVKHWLSLLIILIVVVGTAWDICQVAWRGERARRGLPVKVPGSGGGYSYGG
ncbi:permease prefix domain 1-containing protein [Actinoplanes sp. KI2]|uniref:permease prefix domain 1-containing protein n=1 Tax=Actinoplanes sp. KI2 TaxID=2983315 RepID=UPI0021D60317|nr:permease prefix domain 1-containing protein [Actinoplanes sp. KI2]MCU7726850.1 permease prefix domain 1-containing protein [Actinoplanes sp. KI2]